MPSNRQMLVEGEDWSTASVNKRTSFYRIDRYSKWLDDTGRNWDHIENVISYAHYLNSATDLSLSTIRTHISTIRARYKRIARDNPSLGIDLTTIIVDDIIKKLTEAGRIAKVDLGSLDQQVKSTTTHYERLTVEQASAYLLAPGFRTLKGRRDTALIGLMLCTGIRDSEVRGIDISDLRYQTNGMLALHVPNCESCNERIIPYGGMSWVLEIVGGWLEISGITEGPVFRGLYKEGKSLRPGRIGLRTIGQILDTYYLEVGPFKFKITSMTLRRTYARELYRAGLDIATIQTYLGLGSREAVLDYIGETEAKTQKPPSLYDFNTVQSGGK